MDLPEIEDDDDTPSSFLLLLEFASLQSVGDFDSLFWGLASLSHVVSSA
jgi:hypothetical protein